jgi:uncharacterized membrane protein YfcA
MDGLLDVSLFLLATFAAAMVAGLAGFAFGLVAAAVWLHILEPVQTAALIISFGLLVQGYAVWNLRHALSLQRLLPFLIGAAFGVPVGVALLELAAPAHVRAAVGVLLVIYAIHAFARPALKPVAAGPLADAGVGFLNGILGGMTGLAGVLVTIWCGLRGWKKDEQRAVFQPVGVAIFAMAALWLGVGGAITPGTVWLFVLGLPVLLAGTWLGLRLYGRLDEAGFRTIVLLLLFASGVALLL